MNDRTEVLFVCVHNAGRSQMAAALVTLRSEGRVGVRSAGSALDDPTGQTLETVRWIRDELDLRVRVLLASNDLS